MRSCSGKGFELFTLLTTLPVIARVVCTLNSLHRWSLIRGEIYDSYNAPVFHSKVGELPLKSHLPSQTLNMPHRDSESLCGAFKNPVDLSYI